MLKWHKHSTKIPKQLNSLVPLHNLGILVFVGISAVTPVLKFPLGHKQVDHKGTNEDSQPGRVC